MTAIKTQLLRTLASRSVKSKEDPTNKAFTLVELMIVIVIVGILSAVALPNFLNQTGKAKTTTEKRRILIHIYIYIHQNAGDLHG